MKNTQIQRYSFTQEVWGIMSTWAQPNPSPKGAMWFYYETLFLKPFSPPTSNFITPISHFLVPTAKQNTLGIWRGCQSRSVHSLFSQAKEH